MSCSPGLSLCSHCAGQGGWLRWGRSPGFALSWRGGQGQSRVLQDGLEKLNAVGAQADPLPLMLFTAPCVPPFPHSDTREDRGSGHMLLCPCHASVLEALSSSLPSPFCSGKDQDQVPSIPTSCPHPLHFPFLQRDLPGRSRETAHHIPSVRQPQRSSEPWLGQDKPRSHPQPVPGCSKPLLCCFQGFPSRDRCR